MIKRVYEESSNGKNGIVLIGHSLGAATSLSLAALDGGILPILGVSALGIIPTEHHPPSLVALMEANPEHQRFVVEASLETIETFMGPVDTIDLDAISSPAMLPIFESGNGSSDHCSVWRLTVVGLKSEMLEWFSPDCYDRFVNVIAPGIHVRDT